MTTSTTPVISSAIFTAAIQIDKLRDAALLRMHGAIALGDDETAYWEARAAYSLTLAAGSIDQVLQQCDTDDIQ